MNCVLPTWIPLILFLQLVNASQLAVATVGSQSVDNACTGDAEVGCTTTSYVSWYSGSATGWPPIILSAPHGGNLHPPSIRNRVSGCWDQSKAQCVWTHSCGTKNLTKCKAVTDTDLNTYKLTIALRRDLTELFHHPPATVLNNLMRIKFDANRDEPEASFGVPEVQQAFNEYNDFIDRSKQLIVEQHGYGLFVDIHGHGHSRQLAELGYGPRGSEFDTGKPIDPNRTFIRSLAARTLTVNFDGLLRGNVSFGAFLEKYGFDAVPSPKHPGPDSHTYFNGGYLTRRHGSMAGGMIDAIQIESAQSVRSDSMVPCYARALACTLHRYICTYYRKIPEESATSVELHTCSGEPWEMCEGLACVDERRSRSDSNVAVAGGRARLELAVLSSALTVLFLLRFH
jgi:hypothetical protein